MTELIKKQVKILFPKQAIEEYMDLEEFKEEYSFVAYPGDITEVRVFGDGDVVVSYLHRMERCYKFDSHSGYSSDNYTKF